MTAIARENQEHDTRLVTRAVVNAADNLGLTSVQLARVIGASEATVSRMRHGRAALSPAHKHWELALLLIRLYRSLDAICAGDSAVVRAWMRGYNRDLGGVPAEQINRVQGLTATLAYVDSSRAAA